MTTTTKLSATQESLLKTAAVCADRAIRWPANLRGGARTKIILALVDAGLAENRNGTLVITDAGMRAVGAAPDAAPARATGRRGRRAGTGDAAAGEAARAGATDAPKRKTREGSKQARLVEMLKRPEGATIAEIAATFGWQLHTVRGAIAGALKKKLGLTVTSEKVDGRGRVYRIIPKA